MLGFILLCCSRKFLHSDTKGRTWQVIIWTGAFIFSLSMHFPARRVAFGYSLIFGYLWGKYLLLFPKGLHLYSEAEDNFQGICLPCMSSCQCQQHENRQQLETAMQICCSAFSSWSSKIVMCWLLLWGIWVKSCVRAHGAFPWCLKSARDKCANRSFKFIGTENNNNNKIPNCWNLNWLIHKKKTNWCDGYKK